MTKLLFRFFIALAVSISIIFTIHTLILDYLNHSVYQDKTILAYIVNIVLAILIFVVLYIFRIKYRDQLGFLYMGGSMLKFAVFFILFYPTYKSDGNINKFEFAAFFIPYTISLLVETFYLIRLLNSPELNQPNIDKNIELK